MSGEEKGLNQDLPDRHLLTTLKNNIEQGSSGHRMHKQWRLQAFDELTSNIDGKTLKKHPMVISKALCLGENDARTKLTELSGKHGLGQKTRNKTELTLQMDGAINMMSYFPKAMEKAGYSKEASLLMWILLDAEKNGDYSKSAADIKTARSKMMDMILRDNGISVVDVPPVSVENHFEAFKVYAKKKILTFSNNQDSEVNSLHIQTTLRDIYDLKKIWKKNSDRQSRISTAQGIKGAVKKDYQYWFDNPDEKSSLRLIMRLDNLVVAEARYNTALSGGSLEDKKQASSALLNAQILLYTTYENNSSLEPFPYLLAHNKKELDMVRGGPTAKINKDLNISTYQIGSDINNLKRYISYKLPNDIKVKNYERGQVERGASLLCEVDRRNIVVWALGDNGETVSVRKGFEIIEIPKDKIRGVLFPRLFAKRSFDKERQMLVKDYPLDGFEG